MVAKRTRIDGHELTVTNLDKVLYPATGTTKAEVVAYELEIAPAKLPHLVGRPVTFRRFPDGVDAPGFYQKRCPKPRPAWLATLELGAEGSTSVSHCEIRDAAGLAWAANLAALEFHVPLARSPQLDAPSAVVFDLDPGAPAGVLACAGVALRLRTLFTDLGLESHVKTSGSKGLQVYVPIEPGSADYPRTRGFAHAVARLLEARTPGEVVSVQARDQRGGKVLIDWLQNHRIKTTVCAYSLRARERPTVSTPLAWVEVQEALDAADDTALRFELWDTVERVQRFGDLFAGVESGTQHLPALP